MPIGVYKRTEKHLQILRKARSHIKRKPLSEDTKRKISQANSRKIKCKCDYCGEIIYCKPYFYNKNKHHFCSRNCYSKYREEVLPRNEQPRYGTGYPIKDRKKRIKARAMVNHAIRDGKIIRQCCEICGEKAEAHHDDYNKPMEVRWLCFKHHREYHNIHKSNLIINHQNPELLKEE